MKKTIQSIIAVSAASVMVLLTGCASGIKINESTVVSGTAATTVETTKDETTTQATEMSTKASATPSTAPSTALPTDPPVPKEYTAEELLTKSVPEILEIVGYTINVQVSGYGSSSTGSFCFYNSDILPGFMFCPNTAMHTPDNTELSEIKQNILSGDYETLSFIAVIDNGKVNDLFSADMTYNEISGITGNYSTRPPAGQGMIRQDLTEFCGNCSQAVVTYETSKEAMKHADKTGYDPEYLKQENPKAENITLYIQ